MGYDYNATNWARQRRKRQGRCATCEWRTTDYWCFRCAPRERARCRLAVRALRAERRAKGLCIECGMVAAVKGGRCAVHAINQWMREQKRGGRLVTFQEGRAWLAKKSLDKKDERG